MHESLLNVVLLDQLPDRNAQKPPIPLSRKLLQRDVPRVHDKSVRS